MVEVKYIYYLILSYMSVYAVFGDDRDGGDNGDDKRHDGFN